MKKEVRVWTIKVTAIQSIIGSSGDSPSYVIGVCVSPCCICWCVWLYMGEDLSVMVMGQMQWQIPRLSDLNLNS